MLVYSLSHNSPQTLKIWLGFQIYPLNFFKLHPNLLSNHGLLREPNEGGAWLPRDSERLVFNVFNWILSLQLMGRQDSKLSNTIYQFISSPVLTVLCQLNRGFLKNGENMFVQTESEQGLRVSKFTSLLAIFGKTRV